MLISQILLTGFVIYWLADRYRQEKALLYKELVMEFKSSEQKMLDTMIVKMMINPVLEEHSMIRDSSRIMTHITSKPDKDTQNIRLKKNANIIYLTIKDSVKSFESKDHLKNKLQTFKFLDSVSQDSFTKPVRMPFEPDKIILQGVKLFAEKGKDSTKMKRSYAFNFTGGFDTSLLRESFDIELKKNGFLAEWHPKKEEKSGMFISSEMLENKVGAEIGNYKLYLFQKLLPNLFFGMVLLILTAASFIIAFVSLRKQMQLNKIRNDFVSNVSHELKTPVATVKVALEAIQNFNIKNEKETADEYIRMATLEMNRLDLLIQKVLNNSVYEDGKNYILKENIDLKALIENVLKTFEIRFKARNCKVDFVDETKDSVFQGDKLHIEGVISNLIDNSLKYSVVDPKIDIKILGNSDRLILAVSDNGTGIPEEYLSRVFEKFFRVPNENIHNVKGYGLGLNYASEIMKQHQGKISVKNNKSEGCTFILEFPKVLK